MKKLLFALAAVFVSATLATADADAARLGGGRSSGMQRHYSPAPPRQVAPPARQAPAAAPASRPSLWPSMLGGLAMGGLLGSMFGGGGGGGFGGLLVLALIVFGVVMLAKMLLRAPQAPPREEIEQRWRSGG